MTTHIPKLTSTKWLTSKWQVNNLSWNRRLETIQNAVSINWVHTISINIFSKIMVLRQISSKIPFIFCTKFNSVKWKTSTTCVQQATSQGLCWGQVRMFKSFEIIFVTWECGELFYSLRMVYTLLLYKLHK